MDVVYKTIIRDMRKFFAHDFNRVTDFMKKKRFKRDSKYFFDCMIKYLETNFK